MEKKLHEACINGDVEKLEAIMKEDKLTLARVSLSSSFKQTPLHLACMLGHFELAASIISHKSDFVSTLDSEGRSPLHLACANGYLDIVQLLLENDPKLKMCAQPDEDGRTPLHLAVMNGRFECINELIKVNSKYDQEGIVLHLCVVYNRLNVLIPLLDQWNDKNLSNHKDEKGNTILHSAAASGKTKIVKYLVTRSEVDLNLPNEKGLTALQMIEKMPQDTKNAELKEILTSAATERVNENNNAVIVAEDADGSIQKELAKGALYIKSKMGRMLKRMTNFTIFQDKRENRDESLLVAATVIAAMAYQAAISPPGGVASVDAAPSSDAKFTSSYYDYKLAPGVSLVAYFNAPLSDTFWMSNTISFMAALVVIFLFVSGASLKRKLFVWLIRAAMWITLTSMTITYVCAVISISPYVVEQKTILAIIFGLLLWLIMVFVSFMFIVIQFLIFIIRFFIKKHERKTTRITTADNSTPSPSATPASDRNV